MAKRSKAVTAKSANPIFTDEGAAWVDINNRREVSNAVLQMSYGDLMHVGEQLAAIKLNRLETREDFARLLYEWAGGQ